MYEADPFMENARLHIESHIKQEAIDEIRDVRLRDEQDAVLAFLQSTIDWQRELNLGTILALEGADRANQIASGLIPAGQADAFRSPFRQLQEEAQRLQARMVAARADAAWSPFRQVQEVAQHLRTMVGAEAMDAEVAAVEGNIASIPPDENQAKSQ